jgi:hypothetical protein
MGYGNIGIPSFPASAMAVYMPDFNPSVQNSTGGICDFYEGIYQIKDLSGNGYHGVQTTSTLRPRFIKWTGDNYFWGAGASNGSKITWLNANTGGTNPIISDFTFEIKLSAVSWASGASQYLLQKDTYINVFLTSTGTISFQRVGAAGSTVHTSTAAVPFATNDVGWIRLTYINNTGGGNYSAVFETSVNGSSWTQLGTTVTGVSEVVMAVSSSDVAVGGQVSTSTLGFNGRIYSVNLQDTTTPAARIVWLASASTHMAATGASTTGGTATYVTAGTVRSTGALIGKSMIINNNSGAGGQFVTPSIPLTSSWQIAGKLVGIASNNAATIYSSGGNILGVICAGNNYYVANATNRAAVSDSSSPLGNTNVTGEYNGAACGLVRNLSRFGPVSPGTVAAGNYDTIYLFSGNGMMGRVGGWLYANRPTDAAMNTWLNA